MFFDDPSQAISLATKTGFTIFVTSQPLDFQNAIQVAPEKGKIRIDQIRDLADLVKTKIRAPRFIVVEHAETMNPEAQNAFLKLLEEPQENYHFVLLTSDLGQLLPTVRSRAQIYFTKNPTPRVYDAEVKNLARTLITASGPALVHLAEDLTNKKLHKYPRADALNLTAAAIDLLSQSYYQTQNPKFLKKLSQLIALHQNLAGNGHIKLHIVADLC